MIGPVQIRKPAVTERLRRLSRREGLSITDLVDQMTRDREAQGDAVKTADIERRMANVQAILARVDALPRLAPWPTDDDFYDEDGLPK